MLEVKSGAIVSVTKSDVNVISDEADFGPDCLVCPERFLLKE